MVLGDLQLKWSSSFRPSAGKRHAPTATFGCWIVGAGRIKGVFTPLLSHHHDPSYTTKHINRQPSISSESFWM